MNITTSQLIEKITELKTGDNILLSGVIYTARDAAHKLLARMISENKQLPLDLNNAIIYYCGPCPAKKGEPIGSCGPTTSSRMDVYTPLLMSQGVKATIGKGPRSRLVKDAIVSNGGLYLLATGGAGALLSRKVKISELIAFPELGAEAIYRLEVKEFPLIVGIDSTGRDIFNKL